MINRKILTDLKAHLNKKEFSLIVGPRQAGKTTVMKLLQNYLKTQGEKTLFLSLDFESDQPFFISQSALVKKIQLEFGQDKGYVFIDEIQRKENAGLFLKGLYDLGLPYKIIVSGSGSLELKEKIHESLVGRKQIFEMGTLSFEEFVDFKTDYHYPARLHEFFAVESQKTKELFLEYLHYGGYPRVVLESSLQGKKQVIDDIYRSFLERDISFLLKVEKLEAFRHLIKILAAQIGRLINFSELSSTLGVSLATAQNYLWYAQQTFTVEKITPYFKNVRKEITKSPVGYFYDLGLRNYALGLWENLPLSADQGFLFQNFVLSLLKEKLKNTPAEIHFWRTKDKAEVDFVIDYGKEIIPVEVKFTDMKQPAIERSLRSFISNYKPARAWVVNLSLKETFKIHETQVHVMPFYELMFPKTEEKT